LWFLGEIHDWSWSRNGSNPRSSRSPDSENVFPSSPFGSRRENPFCYSRPIKSLISSWLNRERSSTFGYRNPTNLFASQVLKLFLYLLQLHPEPFLFTQHKLLVEWVFPPSRQFPPIPQSAIRFYPCSRYYIRLTNCTCKSLHLACKGITPSNELGLWSSKERQLRNPYSSRP